MLPVFKKISRRITVTKLVTSDFVLSGDFTKSDHHLLETNFPDCEPTPSLESIEPPNEEDWLEARIISEDKTKLAFVGFEPFKPAGENGIFPALLKRGVAGILNHFNEFLRRVWLWVVYQRLGES